MITELIPTAKEHVNYIREKIPLPDLYEQLAEEASELSQAANKMSRYLRGINPTPKSEQEIRSNLIEEYTDVVNVACNILDIHPDWLVSDYKLYRWSKRLEENANSFECESCKIE